MNDAAHFEPLTPKCYATYITVGTQAYDQHYQHLWPGNDTSTYIEHSFTLPVLLEEEKDNNTSLFLIKVKDTCIGILKITYDKHIQHFSKRDALYIDKIYILKEYTGKGFGHQTLDFIEELALENDKKVIFLEAMQKGPAFPFYIANGFNIGGITEIPFENAIETEKPMFTMIKELKFVDEVTSLF